MDSGKSKIVVIKFDNYQGGGTFVVARSVLNALKKTGKEISLCYIQHGRVYCENAEGKTDLGNIKFVPPFLQNFYQNILIRKIIKRNDVIVCLQGTSLYLPSKNHKIVYVHHSNAFRYYDDIRWKPFFKKISNALEVLIILFLEAMQKPDELIFNSEYSLQRAYHMRSKNKQVVIYPPVPFRRQNGSNLKQRMPFVSLGRIHPEKNHELQLKLAALFPDLSFEIIGITHESKYFHEFDKKVKKLKNVEVFYTASEEIIDNKLNRATFFLHTMIGEHFGIAVGEAAMRGCIPIINFKGGAKEIAPEFSLIYNNETDLISLLKRINDGEKFNSPTADQVQVVRDKFSETRFQNHFMNIIKKYIKNG